jgi:acyl-CoA thioester hydrolase
MIAAPFICPPRTVLPEWIDYNGHLNMAYYHVLFDKALDHVFDELGIGVDYVRTEGGTSFTMEVHVCYLQELALGDPVEVRYQLLDQDAKRIHVFGGMFHAEKGYLAATSEQLCLHVSMATRRSCPFPDNIQARISEVMDVHRQLPRPEQAGRVIAIKRGIRPAPATVP